MFAPSLFSIGQACEKLLPFWPKKSELFQRFKKCLFLEKDLKKDETFS